MPTHAPMTLLTVLSHAPLFVTIVMLLLLGLSIAAAAVGAGKLRPGAPLAGGSAFLSNLRWGGPMTGLLGGAYGGLNMLLGIANAADEPPMPVLAPGLAEMVLLISLGLITGIIATIANTAVESRIDRAVLRA
jgi:hypothetical protein